MAEHSTTRETQRTSLDQRRRRISRSKEVRRMARLQHGLHSRRQGGRTKFERCEARGVAVGDSRRTLAVLSPSARRFKLQKLWIKLYNYPSRRSENLKKREKTCAARSKNCNSIQMAQNSSKSWANQTQIYIIRTQLDEIHFFIRSEKCTV